MMSSFRQQRPISNPLLWLAASIMMSLSTNAFSQIILASNEDVLQEWQRVAQAGSAEPALVTADDGATHIEWHGSASVDAYYNKVRGGSLLSPLQQGNHYKATVQGDLRNNLKSGGMSYMQFTASHSNDRAVLTENSQLDLFQAGVIQSDYGIAAGDVSAGFSTLGTNTQMKGLYGYKQFERVVITASLGKIAESWEVLAGTIDNTRYESNAHAIKVDAAVGDYARVYVTNQAFSEDEDSLDSELRSVTAAKAETSTVGFEFQKDRFTLKGEYGGSDWEESSGYSYRDNATVIDGQWRGERVGLNAGFHDIGEFYSSLSASVSPGIGETYVGADWAPVQWLSFVVDMRNSQYHHAVYSSDIESTDAVTSQVGVGLDRFVNGLNLSLQHSLTDGVTVDDSSNDVEDYAVNLSYSGAQHWNAQAGYSHQSVENSAYPDTNSQTNTLSAGLNMSLNRNAQTASIWNLNVGVNATRQEQDMEVGSDITNNTHTLTVDAKRMGLGSLTASFTNGVMEQEASGTEITQQQINLEASRTWGKNNTVKLYARENDNSGDDSSDYTESTIGLQLTMAW